MIMRAIIRRFTHPEGAQPMQDASLGNVPAQSSHAAPDQHEEPTSHQAPELDLVRTAQQDPQTPTLRLDTSSPSSKHNISQNPSPSERLADNIEDLKCLQSEIPMNPEKRPREPELAMFRKFPSCTIVLPIIDKPLEYCMLLLHDYAQDEKSLKNLARRLQQKLKECVFILLRGPTSVQDTNSSIGRYCWRSPDQDQGFDEHFFWSSRYILEAIILKRLVTRCYFRPRNIVILGHGQGAMVALRSATIWNDVEFGGIIAVGSSFPVPTQLSALAKTKTPVLLVRGIIEKTKPSALESLREIFSFVDLRDRPGRDEDPPTGLQEPTGLEDDLKSYIELKPYLDFLVHRLRRDEWKKQDVISFDGGGMRGYGSLLILKALMEKIADEEKIQDDNVESSFHPCPFKPTRFSAGGKSEDDTSANPTSRNRTDSNDIVAEKCEDHPSKSARFLPCHYFTYAAGTSTGGLITIMLQRLRMTVDECIEEYKNLGGEVFGRPRPPVINKIIPKFDETRLKNAIKDVCKRRGEAVDWGNLSYTPTTTTDDDLCRCMVLAISYQGATRKLYPFRTYRTPPAREALSSGATRVQKSRGFGEPSRLPVWKVARATSAAPGYFAPIEIRSGRDKVHVFKDGGFGHNNPSQEMYNDIVQRHEERNLGVFVSIGTGETELNFESARNHIRDTLSNLKVAIKLPTMTGPVHNVMNDLCKENKKFIYVRLDGGKELGKVAMDEWDSHKLTRLSHRNPEPGHKTLQKIQKATLHFLEQEEVNDALTDLAKRLVERRRLRARDASEWDRFASFSYYSCESQWPHCERPRWRTADEFREHIKSKHIVSFEQKVIDAHLDEGRRHGWVYRTQDPTAT